MVMRERIARRIGSWPITHGHFESIYVFRFAWH